MLNKVDTFTQTVVLNNLISIETYKGEGFDLISLSRNGKIKGLLEIERRQEKMADGGRGRKEAQLYGNRCDGINRRGSLF